MHALNPLDMYLFKWISYALLPLLLLLDSAIACRSCSKIDPDDRRTESIGPATPFEVSDIVAEGVLNCLEELLKKCSLEKLNQVLVFFNICPFLSLCLQRIL